MNFKKVGTIVKSSELWRASYETHTTAVRLLESTFRHRVHSTRRAIVAAVWEGSSAVKVRHEI